MTTRIEGVDAAESAAPLSGAAGTSEASAMGAGVASFRRDDMSLDEVERISI